MKRNTLAHASLFAITLVIILAGAVGVRAQQAGTGTPYGYCRR